MVTCSSNVEGKRSPQVFFGLSTDDKPVLIHNGIVIPNASIFIEIDTGKYNLYDEENKTWYQHS